MRTVALATGGGIVNRLSPSGGFTPGGSGGAWVRAGAGLHDQLPTHRSAFGLCVNTLPSSAALTLVPGKIAPCRLLRRPLTCAARPKPIAVCCATMDASRTTDTLAISNALAR